MANKRAAPLAANLRNPIQFLAFGFGSGLSPKAPGTAGTLAAIPLFLLVDAALANTAAPLLWYSLFILVTAGLGIWICDRASKQLGVHDHPGIVWDEFVGYWITLWALPAGWVWVLAGFVAFRIFDILKPWPISWLDRKVKGGFGIMIDDVLAGVMACACLHAVAWLVAAS
ncbi:MAG: phosphatidylglycerophosphatase A [Haliea sp.]